MRKHNALNPLSPTSAPSKCDAVPVCSHGGCDVILHGRQEVQDGVLGGSSVPRGQAHSGGAECSAGTVNLTNINITCTLFLMRSFVAFGVHTHTFTSARTHLCGRTHCAASLQHVFLGSGLTG